MRRFSICPSIYLFVLPKRPWDQPTTPNGQPAILVGQPARPEGQPARPKGKPARPKGQQTRLVGLRLGRQMKGQKIFPFYRTLSPIAPL